LKRDKAAAEGVASDFTSFVDGLFYSVLLDVEFDFSRPFWYYLSKFSLSSKALFWAMIF